MKPVKLSFEPEGETQRGERVPAVVVIEDQMTADQMRLTLDQWDALVEAVSIFLERPEWFSHVECDLDADR